MAILYFENKWKRDRFCGELKIEEKKQVTLNGWVRGLREHSQQLFLDLWDDSGLVQVVFPSSVLKERKIHYGDVLAVKGYVRPRPQGMANKNLSTGDIEVSAKEVQIISSSSTPPFRAGSKTNEDLSLKYRYLDLRYREDLRTALKTRHQVNQIIRDYLSKKGFHEIETPILYKSTPEGARDYLVPSRNQKGTFYALPQSPQTLKQILMVAGMEKYFQICRCFRDEDLRSDRQPEFSQIDIEMSFASEEEIREISEGLVRRLWKEVKGEVIGDISSLSYEEALSRFGTDKPDLRNSLELKILSPETVKKTEIKILESGLREGCAVKALFIPDIQLSGSRLKSLNDFAQTQGVGGLLWINSLESDTLKSPLEKWTSSEKLKELFLKSGGKGKGVCFLCAGEITPLNNLLSSLVCRFGEEGNFIQKDKTAFVWITDFPLLQFDPKKKRWTSQHHPFTSPQKESLSLLEKGEDLSLVKARAYDLVCNGHELAGGSIRNHSLALQKKIFSLLDLEEKEVQKRFGFFLEALSYGCPPHGGIAWGLERLMMLLMGTENIRDVMAFPKSASASCLMSEAPSEAEPEHLAELGLQISNRDKGF